MPTYKTAIVLVNLGSPAAPTAAALRRYLAEFLWDPRVVALPRLPWWLILHGWILPTRPARSAAKYAQIWLAEGSPLVVHTERQAKLLRGLLGSRGQAQADIAWAMRYGQPALPDVLQRLAEAGCQRIHVLPLYPQHARSTTASVEDACRLWQQRTSAAVKLQVLPSFPVFPAYIAALAASVRRHWQRAGRFEGRFEDGSRLLVMSFHGIPQRSVDQGDPYQKECLATAQALAEALQLRPEEWQLTFQSRFGRARWLSPYTQQTLEELAGRGVKSVDVICPGFVADCLETLEEIDLENRAAFLAAGGRNFHYIPCLNEDPDWIAALADILASEIRDSQIAAAA